MVSAKCAAPPSARSVSRLTIECHTHFLCALSLTISIYTRHDDISYTPSGDGFCCILWLVWVKRRWFLGRLDRAEAAPSCACIPHEHNGSSSISFVTSPALSNIGTSSFFADCMQVETSEIVFDLVVRGRGRDCGFQVFWKTWSG